MWIWILYGWICKCVNIRTISFYIINLKQNKSITRNHLMMISIGNSRNTHTYINKKWTKLYKQRCTHHWIIRAWEIWQKCRQETIHCCRSFIEKGKMNRNTYRQGIHIQQKKRMRRMDKMQPTSPGKHMKWKQKHEKWHKKWE